MIPVEYFVKLTRCFPCIGKRRCRVKDVSRSIIYRNDNVLNGVFEVLRKMVAQSMIQGGPGFPYLSPVVYCYIGTGNLQQGIARASVIDIGDVILNSYITRVSAAFTFPIIIIIIIIIISYLLIFISNN